tara:strand:- start:196 stop:426 length:231 start_codon:yes stop_codon:yes gene_type:complete
MKELVLTRVPPGDRWRDKKDGLTMDNLTDAIEHIFQRTGDKQFYIDCARGEIHVDDGIEPEKEPSMYSIYGEEIQK